jgi:hypothetical protein
VELAPLADDARLESDRFLVVVDGQRSKILGRHGLLRGAVLLADRHLRVADDFHPLDQDGFVGHLKIRDRRLVRVHVNRLVGGGFVLRLDGERVGPYRNLDDRVLAFHVRHGAHRGALETDRDVGSGIPLFIRDFSRDHARLRLRGSRHGTEREAEEERGAQCEHRQSPATA